MYMYITMYVYAHTCIIDEVFDELMMWITVFCQNLKTSLNIDNRIDHFIGYIVVIFFTS